MIINIFKHILVILVTIILIIPAGFVKQISLVVLTFISKILELPIFNWVTGGQPWLIDILWNSILTSTISDVLFTVTVIYLNHLIFKKLFRWDISFTPSLIFLIFILLASWVSIFVNGEFNNLSSLALSLPGLYERSMFTGTLLVSAIFSIGFQSYVFYLSFKKFDNEGNWNTNDTNE